jgi:hypothetical protein
LPILLRDLFPGPLIKWSAKGIKSLYTHKYKGLLVFSSFPIKIGRRVVRAPFNANVYSLEGALAALFLSVVLFFESSVAAVLVFKRNARSDSLPQFSSP